MTVDLQDLERRTRALVAAEILPVDDQFDGDIAAAGGDVRRRDLQRLARAAGVFAPHAPVELGGHGLGMDAGGRASQATSLAKTFAGEALDRVADRATQLCGGLGVSADLPVAKIARELRPFRICDGPSEVHRWATAERAVRAAGRVAP